MCEGYYCKEKTRWKPGGNWWYYALGQGRRVEIERNVQLRDALEEETIGLAENATRWEGMTEGEK